MSSISKYAEQMDAEREAKRRWVEDQTCGQSVGASNGLGSNSLSPVRRETVHDVIDQRLSDLRLELNQLDALRRQLPQEMNLPAQEALINLIRRQSR